MFISVIFYCSYNMQVFQKDVSFFYLFDSFYLNLYVYICKMFGNLPQKGTFLAILVGKNLMIFLPC